MWLLVVSPIESTRTGRSWHVVRGWSAWSNRCPACSDAYTNELNYVVAHFRAYYSSTDVRYCCCRALLFHLYRPPRCCSSPTPRRRPQRPRWTSTSDISRTQVNDETINHEWPFLKAPYLLAGLECYYYSLRQSVRHPFYGRTKAAVDTRSERSAGSAKQGSQQSPHLCRRPYRFLFRPYLTPPPLSFPSVIGRWLTLGDFLASLHVFLSCSTICVGLRFFLPFPLLPCFALLFLCRSARRASPPPRRRLLHIRTICVMRM